MRALVVLVVIVVVAGTARAEDRVTVRPEDRVTAETLFRAGERAYRAQNFAGAAEDFYEAWRALPLPEIAFSAAQAYRRQYRVEAKPLYVERAVTLYRAYL